MARKITKIPQKINPLTLMPNDTVVKRKVAGYARVSTDQEEQLTSYEAPVKKSCIVPKKVACAII